MSTFELIWEQVGARDISAAGEDRLRVLVQRAAKRMDSERRTEPADLTQAAERTGVLLDRAADVAKEQRGVPEIGGMELGIAMSGLCPGFWPFC